MESILVLTALTALLLIHIVGCCAFMEYLKRIHYQQNLYLYNALKEVKPDILKPEVIMRKAEASMLEKAKAWIPSKDMDHRLSGELVDEFD